MSDVTSLRDTVVPKSDQLNADTLLAGPITVTVTDVRRGTSDQPIDIHITDGHQPWRPCKSMRRALISAWGENGKDWIGKTMTLYCDPSVKFGGVAVGGIRVSHMSHLQSDLSLSLTSTRGKRTPHLIKKLVTSLYPEDKFQANIGAWLAAIAAGKATAEQIIQKVEQTGSLTEAQKQSITNPQEATQ